ncbi:MAG TPA: hypothetical protein VLA66_05515 [Thermoanaerobaculia bacterium]|nr:hypothetical protein [Thermoanaerobaculia bacterium]
MAAIAVAGLALGCGGAPVEPRPRTSGGGLPRLLVEAPPELAGEAGRVRAVDPRVLERALRLTGLERPGDPIRVLLLPESSPMARATPAWVAGLASGSEGTVVLFPARAGRYPDPGLAPLVGHEVAHVLIARAARGGAVPRWFDEGVAMAAGRERDVGDRARVALAVLTRGRLPLARLDRAFHGGSGDVESAYALARDLVRELLDRHGEAVAGEILAGIGRGEPFERAFAAATGESLGEFESAYWRNRTLWDRWLPIVTSSVVLWIAISLLALAAFRRRAARDAAIHRRWQLEEEAEALRRELEALRSDDHGSTFH